MPTRGKNPRDEFDDHEMESRSSFDQHKNQKGGNKMKRRIEMSEIPIGIAASALGAVVDTIDLQRFKPNIQPGRCCSKPVQDGMDSHAKEQAVNSQTEGPTLAATWHTVAGSPITDEFLEWPADLFALTDVILERSEAYRFVLSPPSGLEWPPSRFPNWSEQSRRRAGSGACGSRIGIALSLIFWLKSGASSASEPGCRSDIWQRDTIRECARRS
jgi:hypothetical protein